MVLAYIEALLNMPKVQLRVEHGAGHRGQVAEVDEETLVAREAYLRDYRDRIRQTKMDGAVDGEYIRDKTGRWLMWDRAASEWVPSEPWWTEE